MAAYTMKKAMCDTFSQAVELESFKHGAFRGQIAKDTSFEDAINIFLMSNAVPDFEKEKYFRPMQCLMAAMDEKEQRQQNYPEKLLDMHKMSELCAVFSIDMQSRYSGGTEFYDAPMLVQKVQPGLEVTGTYTVDNDGNKKHFAAGEYGVDPGAPEWYKRMQVDRMKPFVDSLKKEKAEPVGVHDGEPKPHESSHGHERHICARAPVVQAPMSQSASSKSTNTNKTDIDDFSAAFKNNAKRFFL